MKKLIAIAIACAFVAPLAFAQQPETATTTKQVSKSMMKETAVVESFTSGTTGNKLVLRKAGENPTTWTVAGKVAIEDPTGKALQVADVKSGMVVHVYYTGPEDNKTVERIVVEQPSPR